jgi:RsiW-degrading membrane proteinase PrsW (M82 family)
MLFFFGCGVVMSIPLTLFVYQVANSLLVEVPPPFASFVSATVLAPLIEEFSKAFPLFYRHGETERSIFNLALLVGLGFGLVEFLTYIFVLGMPWLDRLPGILFHPASTSVTAYGIAKKRTGLFYLVAVGFHFLNNFLVLASPVTALSTAAVVGATVTLSWWLHRRTRVKIIS